MRFIGYPTIQEVDKMFLYYYFLKMVYGEEAVQKAEKSLSRKRRRR